MACSRSFLSFVNGATIDSRWSTRKIETKVLGLRPLSRKASAALLPVRRPSTPRASKTMVTRLIRRSTSGWVTSGAALGRPRPPRSPRA